MKIKNIILSFLLVTAFVSVSVAQDIISAQDAKKLLNSKDAVIVSTRNAADYAKVHIKNAVNINVSDLASTTDPIGILKPRQN